MKSQKPKRLLAEKIQRLFFGHPLRSSAMTKERLGVVGALALFAVDALSSVAYATEEILLALSNNPALLNWSFGIALTITGLLAILVLSYTQTVAAFPNGGGAYTVSKTHLGENTALVAAASLLVDYILTVAVSVSAGVRALSSAFPLLRGNSTFLCCVLILFLCWINLRGIRESARLLIGPVYLFIFGLLFVGGTGIFTSTLPPLPSWSALTDFGAFLILLRAFSSGCSAMTGVEALANAGSLLKKEQAKTAQSVLILMGFCLGALFLSITWTAQAFHLQPLPEESLISQMIQHLFGGGFFYQGLQILIACILFLAANTAFADFPKLSSILAQDSFLPRQLAALGDRLVFSNGIIVLALWALFLVIVFGGSTHHLIPLYAVGVFMAFTLSQAGMAVHWWKTKGFWKKSVRCFINSFGALCTFLVLLVTLHAKFFQGAFLVVLVIPLFWGLLRFIYHHYDRVYRLLEVNFEDIPSRKNFAKSPKKSIVVPVSQFHLGTLEALALARELSLDVTAVIVDIRQGDHLIEKTYDTIKALDWGIDVQVIPSPYRSVVQPLIAFVQDLDAAKGKQTTVLLPELILTHWWEEWLHNHMARHIEKALGALKTPRGETRVVINVPYYLSGNDTEGLS